MNLKQVSYLPFVTRHAKSDCDRHFQKVKDYTKKFENIERVIGHPDVEKALLDGQKQANVHRKNLGKHEIKLIVIIQDQLPPIDKRKRIIALEGIKSTIGVTWFKGENGKPGRVVNHVFPDVDDRSKGLELFQVIETDYKIKINKPDKESSLTKEPEINTNTLVSQVKTRKLWNKRLSDDEKRMKKIPKSKYKNGKYFNSFKF